MNPQERLEFDVLVDEIRAELPELARRALDEITLVIEDEPSPQIMSDEGLEHPDELCGYFVGVSKLDEQVDAPNPLPNRIYVYREGNLALSGDEEGCLDMDELRKQIRITILHELGHYLGMDENELEELGYG